MSPKPLHPDLLHVAPLIYTAWADGGLTRDELYALRDHARRDARLQGAARAVLDGWLDPDSPPDARSLQGLLQQIRRASVGRPPSASSTLADLGMAISGTAASETSATELEALRELEAALGVAPEEAVRALLPGKPTPARPAAAEPAFDPHALNRWLDRDHFELRRRVLDVLCTPEFALEPGLDAAVHRERVLTWCQVLSSRGWGALAYPREFGGEDDAAAAIAVFETLAYHDLSLLVKYGVQFGLFAGSIYLLGTRRHHEQWLRPAAWLELPGCFAMTESGHGSNVRDLETTATYDPQTGEFIVHTPSPSARKDYIGNAALHGRAAVVFAQLRTSGGDHGVHAVIVPIRAPDGGPLPGVAIEDCGLKQGLNGVDNGTLTFDNVRVPRENLLDRYGGVAADGTYTSPIRSPARRFFTMLGALVAGRISIAAASMNASKTALAVGVPYVDRRRQFGPEGQPEVPVLDYLHVQRRLLPALAATYALDFAMKDLVRRFAALTEDESRDIESLAAGLKAFASRHAVETVQACREVCGGQGYMAVNRLPDLRADTDVFTTFEGANAVLLQLVARGLLTDYREEFGELRLWGVVRYVAGRAAAAVRDLNPIAPRRTDPDHLRDPRFHLETLREREERLLASLAARLRHRIEQGEDTFAALNACQDHAIAVAEAHVERVVLEKFQDGVASGDDPSLIVPLQSLQALFGLALLERHAGWFLEKGLFEGPKTRAIRAQVNALCSEIRPIAVPLVRAFGIPDPLLSPVSHHADGRPAV